MRVNNIQNYNNKMSFGTVLGIGVVEKIAVAQERGMLNSEHIANIEKIKNDGKFIIFDLVNKYKIVSRGKEKGIFKRSLFLTLTDTKGQEVALKDVTDLLGPYNKEKNIFHMSKFLKIFKDEYKLADKIIENSKMLEP